jgi:hypothetical protein
VNNDDPIGAQLRLTVPYDEFLARRVAIVSELFARDPYSIDAIILCGALLTGLGARRYGDSGNDQANFERLLLDYWPQYVAVDRVSIPTMMLERFRDGLTEPNERNAAAILRDFPVHEPSSGLRSVTNDPMRETWNQWLTTNNVSFWGSDSFSYARVLFRHFRNSVQHGLEIAHGREARRLGTDEPFFYSVFRSELRFGFDHPRFEDMLRSVIAGLRDWAVANQRDIFTLEERSRRGQ